MAATSPDPGKRRAAGRPAASCYTTREGVHVLVDGYPYLIGWERVTGHEPKPVAHPAADVTMSGGWHRKTP
jgi:hypothetical protein